MAGRLERVDITDPFKETIELVSFLLKRGDLVVYPSDTVYGILGDACRESVSRDILEFKGYEIPRPFIVLAGSSAAAASLCAGESDLSWMDEYWPGPVTLVYSAAPGLPEHMVSDRGTIAIRVPADPLSQGILVSSGLFLLSTSANRMGEPVPGTVEGIDQRIKEGVSLILDGGAIPCREPSMIVDVSRGSPDVIRGRSGQ